MSKEMIISVNGREKKIAIVEDDVVTEFYVERGDENQGIVGNIYKGRVMKVLPGMQSAFVDIGLERDSFLYVSDFFDEEEEEEVEEKREVQRPGQKQRAQRDVARIVESLAERETDEEKESELQVAALRHIAEISEEPAPEPAPDDEDGLAEVADESQTGLSPRQRRQQRLRYADREVKGEKTAAAPRVQEPVVEESEAAETEEEYSGRRRRRPRRRRGGADGPALVEAEDASEGDIEGYPPYVIVHHEPLERITDDDTAATEGEMLKDAMLQERIGERIHEEERRTSLLELELTPEVHVGSLHRSIGSAPGFERVSDDAEAREEEGAGPAEPIYEWPPFPVEPYPAISTEGFLSEEPGDNRQWREEEGRTKRQVEEVDEHVQMVHLDLPPDNLSQDAPADELSDDSSRTGDEGAEGLEDASAKIRQRPRRGEMVTRRGGRGRRRGAYRARPSAAPEPSAHVEEPQEKNGHEQREALPPLAPPPLAAPIARQNDRFARPVITDLLREGQEIIVQIAKEPIGQKGARITSHVALPGRYIVYMPTVEHIGVSRKIGTDEERQRLKRTLHQMRAESGAGGGFIVRTAANGCTVEELREDMQYLIRTWTDIRRRSDRVKAPSIAHRDLDLVQRILRDQLSSDFSGIRVDNEFEYERIVDFVNRFAPKLVNRVKLYTKETPILENYGVQAEIDKAVKPRVWLRSGGYIVINQTEALVAIDVNTGKFVGKSNRLEDTIVKTNLEAAKEIVRQIRLRDLGGIIVLDFIDMEERKNRQKVMGALEQELRSDRSPSKILQFNDFGLVAITRKRVKQSLERTLCTPCAYCGGGGMVKSAQTICYEILAEARRISKDIDHHTEVILRVNPEVAKALRNAERDVLAEIESYLGGLVTIKSDPTVHQEQFDIALA
ncbi:MAG: Rne/Rng family ribonuclease [Blastocatellia bacterium]